MARSIEAASDDSGGPLSEANAGAVRAQLDRILEHPELRGSSRRRDLLCFLVNETLAGRANQLKGFTVAVAVFGRDEDFDPGADPVVRLEAGRLRRSLDTYYVDAGKHDRLRITIPKGAYVPHFEWRDDEAPVRAELAEGTLPDPPPETGPADGPQWQTRAGERKAGAVPGRRSALRPIAAFLAALVLVAAGGAWLWLRGGGPVVVAARGPAVIVVPFDAVGADDQTRLFAVGVTEELITDLMRFPDLRLYSPLASFQQDRDADAVALGRDLGVAYVVRGRIQAAAGIVRLTAQLEDTATGQLLWSDTYDRALTTDALLGMQSELAAAIAIALGEPYGVVSDATGRRFAAANTVSMPSYACILRVYEYRRAFSEALFAPALACLEAAVVRDPDYADAWAMLGWLNLDAARMDMVPAAEHPFRMAAALEATSHAVDLDPQNQRALAALAAVKFYTGDYAGSERVQRQALALNPYDPETLAQLGWRLAVRGNWDKGLAYLEQAIARSASPPGWYFHLIAIHAYLEGDYAAALAAAERSSRVRSDIGAIGAIGLSLAAISRAKLGDTVTARAELEAMAEAWPLLGRDPAAAYSVHHASDEIVEALVRGLREAGWTAPDAPAS